MKKEELNRLKAGLLTCLLLLSMNACSKSEDKKEEIQNETITQPLDINNYLIVFLEDKAIIYNSSAIAYSSREGYAIINESYASMKFIQTPCVVLTGKDNCIKFASEIVGEENVIFMEFENEYDLVLKPNN